MLIDFYKTGSGREPVREYIDDLDKREQAEIYEGLEEIQKRGFDAIGVEFRKIRDKIWEIKFRRQRIFYVFLNDKVILLHAFKKQGQRTTEHDIELGLSRMKEVIPNEN